MNVDMTPEDMLIEGVKAFNIDLGKDDAGMMLRYMGLLSEWNSKINLTAIKEDRDVIIKHFIDSLSITPYLKSKQEKIVDVGTGAGFPGIPVKIVHKDIELLLLDSLEKRIGFLNAVITDLKLDKVQAVHGRAEDTGANPLYREKYDVSVARALATLPVLLEYCLPFVKTGGILIAMKSGAAEIKDSKKALETLGGKIEEVKEFVLPFSDIVRNLIIIRKFRQTPTKFPRKAGKPAKEPLI